MFNFKKLSSVLLSMGWLTLTNLPVFTITQATVLTITQAPAEARCRAICRIRRRRAERHRQNQVREIPKNDRASTGSNHPTVNVTNQFHTKVYLAYGYWNSNNWAARGWFSLAPGETKTVTSSLGNIYIYAESSDGYKTWGANDASFCIDPVDRFSIPNADKVNCSSHGYERVQMYKATAHSGTNNISLD